MSTVIESPSFRDIPGPEFFGGLRTVVAKTKTPEN